MSVELLTNARLADGRLVEIEIDHSGPISTIAAIRGAEPTGAEQPHNSSSKDGLSEPSAASLSERVDLDGALVLAAPVEPHAHLDKAFLAEQVPNETGDLAGAIEAMQRSTGVRTLDQTIERAERAARRYAANGYVAVRSHLDVTVGDRLRNVEAVVEVRERLRDVIEIELVALVGIGITQTDRADLLALLGAALDMGVDLVGGCPHLEPDSQRATDTLLGVATDRGIGVDLHTDETLDPAASGLDELVAAVEAGFDQPVTASHCVALGQRAVVEQRELAERVAAAGIAVVALPQTNLYLQGRGVQPMPRGLTAVDALRAAGAVVAAGTDNVQDPFNPIGRACPFEIAGLMMLTAHLLPEAAWATVATGAAAALRRPSGIVVGAPANLLAVDADTVRAAIADSPTRRRWYTGGNSPRPQPKIC